MPALFLLGLTGVAGVATHLLYFNQNEHHFYAVRYMQIALAVFFTAVAGMTRVGDKGFGEALSIASAYEGTYLAGIYASLLIYRALFHPLNKFPGPFGARLSNFWYTTHIDPKKANAYKLLVKLHGQYGDFLRIGSSDLSIAHPEGPNAVYGPGTKCTKGSWYDADAPLTSMHTSRDRALHDRRRRVWSPAFSDKALRGYESRIAVYSEKLINQINAHGGKPLNATKWFNLFSYDVMGDLAFNKSFSMLDSGEEHWAIKLLNEGMEPLGMNFPTWFFRTLTAIPGLAAGYWKFINYCGDKLDERMNTKGSQDDIIQSLIEPFKGKKPAGKDLSMLQGDARLIIVAGSDTTAATLTHVFHYLAKDPSQADKLRRELEPLLEADGSVSHARVQNAEHLNGCINEALRLNPPVPSAIHRITPPQGLDVGGTHIPGGMDVFCPQYVISRNEEAYARAHEFYPERWYKEPEMIKNKTCFAPFSIGVYGCIGKPLALLEMRTVITKLVMRYDVAFAPGEDGKSLMEDTKDHFTLGLADMNLTFKARSA